MQKGDNKQTEDFLRMFSLRPSPPVLKEKILLETRKRQNSHAMTNSFLWRGLVGCLLLLIFVIAIDAAITRSQNKRLTFFVHKEQESSVFTEEELSLIKDIIGEFSSTTKSETIMNPYHLLDKKKKERRQNEWRESFKKEMEKDEITKDLQ